MSAVLLVARNYKVAASIGFGTKSLSPTNTVLDTGCGPNLVREDQLPTGWQAHLTPTGEEYRLHSASRTDIPVLGRIRMSVQLGTFGVRTSFLFVKTLDVPCILGTS